MKMMKRALASLLAMATVLSVAAVAGVNAANVSVDNAAVLMTASTSAVTVTASEGYVEGAYAEWSAVSNATGYAVYANDTKVDSMLIRQYPGCFRVDVPGLKAGSYTLKIVPIIGGKEDSGKSQEVKVNVTAHDRSGFAFVNGTASGAYNDDGTLRDGAVVLYVTEDTKDTVSLDVITSNKGATTSVTGIQDILTAYQKGYDSRPLCIRCIGNITD
ncbi:MAG: pectate lyase, partial [Oscillospiraceae bacterium]|nr:pectate lyase [Oscillospiraceae bacterium]